MMTDHFAINCLARWLAKKTVKAQLQRQRIKLHSIPAADVTRAANAWLDTHPELYAEAKVLAEQISEHSHRKRRPDPKRQSLCSTPVQNGAAK